MITITPVTIPNAFLYSTTVNDVFTATATIPETIVSMTITADIPDSGIILTNGTTTCSITGNYNSLITEKEFVCISKDKSDLVESPEIVGDATKIPDSKQIIEFRNPVLSKTVTYTVTAKSSLNNIQTKTYTRTVYNTWDNGKDTLLYLKQIGKV